MPNREILFKAKRVDNGEWVEGDLRHGGYTLNDEEIYICPINIGLYENFPVIPETICEYTGLTDKNGKKIFEGDIVEYITFDWFDCHSIVKFGEYKQDGSGGEYSPNDCCGLFVNVNNFTCPDWCENEPEYFSNYLLQQNIKEINKICEVIGNIFDNPELLKEGE